MTTNTDSFQVYLDMDGVLSDFGAAVSCPNTYPRLQQTREKLYKMLPELEGHTTVGLEQASMKQWFKQNADRRKTDKNVADAWQVFKHYQNMFYCFVEEKGFFENLPLFPGARELVEGCIEVGQGKLPMVLTAPVQTPWCPVEKHTWIERHFSGKFERFICQKNKFEYAAPHSVLVDDMMKNITPWAENGGGLGVLYKGDVEDTLKKIQVFRDQAKG